MKPIGYDFPYTSRRMPVLAANVVATSQPLAAQAGLAARARGGNAVDAAVAAAITLTVVEPPNNGLGSDAFAMVWDPKSRQVHGLNGSGRSPAAWNLERFAPHGGMPGFGWDSVTVPGAVSAWVELSSRFGRLPFADLFQAAIAYAENGYLVSPTVATQWELVAKLFGRYPAFAAAYLPDGRAPRAGELFRLPELALALQSVAETGGESFYRGALAEKLLAASRAAGGTLDEDDLGLHRAEWVSPLSIEFAGIDVLELPPNGQGMAAQIALGILAHTPVLDLAPDSSASIHYQIEAMKLGFDVVRREIGDPANMRAPASNLLDRDTLARWGRSIEPERARPLNTKGASFGDTVYLCAADSDGCMVSYIQSNYVSFGSGIVVPGTGISLHNRGLGFNVTPGHPNCVGPRKRPLHTIAPAFATCNGQPLAAFGVMGGNMQPQGHVQLALRMFGHGQNPQAASDAPRWQISDTHTILVEQGVDPAVCAELAARGHEVQLAVPFLFGGAQVIQKHESGYVAASESRKDGQAVGY